MSQKPINHVEEAYRASQVVRRPDGRDPASLYLTVKQVAAMRMCSLEIVRRAIFCGRLPAWVIGGIYLIPRADAEDWALKRSTIITRGGQTKTLRARKLAKLQDAAAARAIANGDVIKRVGVEPEVPGRCL